MIARALTIVPSIFTGFLKWCVPQERGAERFQLIKSETVIPLKINIEIIIDRVPTIFTDN